MYHVSNRSTASKLMLRTDEVEVHRCRHTRTRHRDPRRLEPLRMVGRDRTYGTRIALALLSETEEMVYSLFDQTPQRPRFDSCRFRNGNKLDLSTECPVSLGRPTLVLESFTSSLDQIVLHFFKKMPRQTWLSLLLRPSGQLRSSSFLDLRSACHRHSCCRGTFRLVLPSS